MINAGTGLASGGEPLECAERAARAAMARLAASGAERADMVLLFTSGDTEGSSIPLLHAVRSICGTGNLAGCSGAGVLTEAGEIEGMAGAAVLALRSDSLRAVPFHLRGLRGRDHEVGREIGRLVQPHLDDNALVLLFPDTAACDPDALFEGIREVAGPVPVAGGGAAGTGRSPGPAFQFCGGDAHTNAVSGVVLAGAIASSVGVTQSCLPVGRTWRVTSSEGNSIKSLDGIPAVQALLECLARPGGELTQDAHRLAPHLFVAFPSVPGQELKRGQYVVRNILGVDPDDGALFVGRAITTGETISFALRDPDGARDDLKEMIEECLPAAHRPDLGLYFNCCARGRGLYGMADIDTAYIRNACDDLPLAGFFGFAEIATSKGRPRLHNYSGVMVLVSETPQARPAG
ncbi:MAG TPA: FIST N-terminal domain-containing protein [Candidatus Polarisedimenticolia bacterium]|nr:FIST N-terminal domain-containing protein [Candidatus Polarisedimenticolia bacterium]